MLQHYWRIFRAELNIKSLAATTIYNLLLLRPLQMKICSKSAESPVYLLCLPQGNSLGKSSLPPQNTPLERILQSAATIIILFACLLRWYGFFAPKRKREKGILNGQHRQDQRVMSDVYKKTPHLRESKCEFQRHDVAQERMHSGPDFSKRDAASFSASLLLGNNPIAGFWVENVENA